MSGLPFPWIGLAWLPWIGLGGAQEDPRLERRQTLAIPEPIAAWRVVDVDGDGARELLTVDRAGRVAVRRADAEGRLPAEAEGGLALAHPEHALLALAPLGNGGLELFVVDPDGVRRHAFGAAGMPVTGGIAGRHARNALRLGRPRFAPFARDVNGDGRADLVLPAGDGVDLWLADGGDAPAPGAAPGESDGGELTGFARAAHLPLQVRHSQSAQAELLTDVLSERVSVPALTTADVNGDGRADLIVGDDDRRDYHLQAADGSFPAEPTITLDLSIFRDTTPAATLAPGETLVLADDADLRSGDLTADGIPDHVILHRRKVWVFPGGPEGPQFTEPSMILKTAEDVTTIALLELDDDGLPDLLAVKLVVPSLGALVVGMLAEWDVRIHAVGYRNAGGGRFDVRPMLRSELRLRVPPLVDVLRRPEEILATFEEAASRTRAALTGDFDGDGVADVALVAPDADRIDLWRTPPDVAPRAEEPSERWLRRLIFEDDSGVFDLDRVADLIGDFGDRRTRLLTGGRDSDAAAPLGGGDAPPLVAALPADLDGDGRDEIVCGYEGAGGALVLEVLVLR